MHPEDIKAAIRKNKENFKTIAKTLGISDTTVNHVVHGRGVSAPVAQRIAVITGLPVSRLFPGKYTKPPKAFKARSKPQTA